MGYTLAVYGEHPVTKNLIFDTLCDHFRFGPEDHEGYYTIGDQTRCDDVELILAANTPEGVEALEPLNEWAARAGLTYTLVIASGVKTGKSSLASDAERVVTTQNVAESVASMLKDAYTSVGQEAAIALMCPPGEPDELAQRLIEITEGNAAAYSVSEGLLPVDTTEILPAEPQEPDAAAEQAAPVEEDEAAETEASLRMTLDELELVDWVELRLEAIQRVQEDAFDDIRKRFAQFRKTHNQSVTRLPNEAFDQLVETLAEPAKPNPALSKALRKHAEVVKAPEDAPPAAKPVKVKKEWLDPADGEWKPVGRGRPRKDVQVREVPAA